MNEVDKETSSGEADPKILTTISPGPGTVRVLARLTTFRKRFILVFACSSSGHEMVDKRSLRSSKKDTQDTPEDEEKPKPSRTRSTRGRKSSNKNQEATQESTPAPPAPSTTQSEDVVMETESEAAPEKTNEDVEMKNVSDEGKEEKKDDVPKPDPTASPLSGTHFLQSVLTLSDKTEPAIAG